ncbi:MAG: catabolic L-serine/threonine dehydratase [Vezdaea acicularis]|nr:MAG: catabolic L-serine/threonine dehydratase [Vezdaea acicularis]
MDTLPKTWIRTPLIESTPLSKASGCRVFLKLENLQPSGSFKARGIGNYLIERIREHPHGASLHFFSSSGGNAGFATIIAATTLGYPATIVVPESTTHHVIQQLQELGAEVVQHGPTWAEADAYLRKDLLPHVPDGVYVPPFDHEDVWKGNATMINEILEQLRDYAGKDARPDAVICSVGGGGLLNGVMLALESLPWGRSVRVIAAETKGADSLAASVKAGELVTLPGISSIATSLGATRVSAKSFEYAKYSNVETVVLSDDEAIRASIRFADRTNILIEPACGVVCAVSEDKERLKSLLGDAWGANKNLILVICGGRKVSTEVIEAWRAEYGTKVT